MDLHLEPDLIDLISELNAASVEYLVIGAHAMAAHGVVRFTEDFDILYRPTEENVERLLLALRAFGYSPSWMTKESLMKADSVHHFGNPPLKVEMLNSISGVDFERAWQNRQSGSSEGIDFPILSVVDLIENKKAAGRGKDLLDVVELEKHLTRSKKQKRGKKQK